MTLENQLRFAKHKIAIAIKKDEGCQILISNDGPNFEVEDPNTLFDIHKKDLQGNFGLGLAIVKQVISAHHGSVEASNLEHGILFMIKF
ncbi:ATP-binding protein [Fusibacter sp. 3D3]|uniref:ATP-binding protein n=1 Tax=Fusibacter sp. 3D3 TaxID=1048380 RepID=UPI000A05F50E